MLYLSDPVKTAKQLVRYALWYPAFVEEVLGWVPRPWQKDVLANPRDNHVLATHRQAGKTETVAALAAAVTIDPCVSASTSLVVSTGRDHATDVLRRIAINLEKAAQAGLCEIVEKSKHHVVLGDGSRVFSVASTETATRGWSVSGVLIVDEVAFVPDEVLSALLPVTAAARGSTVLLSTPNGLNGMFSAIYHDEGDTSWTRTTVRASDDGCCLDEDFLNQQHRVLGDVRYSQEFEVSFIDSDASAFDFHDVMRVFGGGTPDVPTEGAEEALDPVVAVDNPFAPRGPVGREERF